MRVTAPAVEGKANAAVCAFLAKQLGVAKNKVQIVKGKGSRDKVVRVFGVNNKNNVITTLLASLF